MNEMIERVAIAANISRNQARAAIEAMREPTRAMLDAAWMAQLGRAVQEALPDMWRAMIDEMLK